MKLDVAIKANLPLISVTTRDTVNLQEVIAKISKRKKILPWKLMNVEFQAHEVYFWIAPVGWTKAIPFEPIYDALVNAESTLIVANYALADPCFFDCGEVEVPRELITSRLQAIPQTKDSVVEVLRGLGGCTIKESLELVSLADAGFGAVTQDTLSNTRRGFFVASKGFTQVETAQPFYLPCDELERWLDDEGGYFLTGDDIRLRARGLLLKGVPGVGKTSGAKHLAHKLGVPLFRVDIAGAKGKWVGSSETALANALARVETEAPCVILLDEIEKTFKVGEQGGDGNTTTGMLSQLLWWLQEHRSRVMTVMTTNNADIIPKELIRPGRVDRAIEMTGLETDDARLFARDLLKTFPDLTEVTVEPALSMIVRKALVATQVTKGVTTHAEITQQCHAYIKSKIKTNFLMDKITGASASKQKGK